MEKRNISPLEHLLKLEDHMRPQLERVRNLLGAYQGTVITKGRYAESMARMLRHLLISKKIIPETESTFEDQSRIVISEEHERLSLSIPGFAFLSKSVLQLPPGAAQNHPAPGTTELITLPDMNQNPIIVGTYNEKKIEFQRVMRRMIRNSQTLYASFSKTILHSLYQILDHLWVEYQSSTLLNNTAMKLSELLNPYHPYNPSAKVEPNKSDSIQLPIIPLLDLLEDRLLRQIEFDEIITSFPTSEESPSLNFGVQHPVFSDRLSELIRQMDRSDSILDSKYLSTMIKVGETLRTGSEEDLRKIYKVYLNLSNRTHHHIFEQRNELCLQAIAEEKIERAFWTTSLPYPQGFAVWIAVMFSSPQSIRRPFESYHHDTQPQGLFASGPLTHEPIIGESGRIFQTDYKIKTSVSRERSQLDIEGNITNYIRKKLHHVRRLRKGSCKLPVIPRIHFQQRLNAQEGRYLDILILTYYKGKNVLEDQLRLEKEDNKKAFDQLRENVILNVAELSAFLIYAFPGNRPSPDTGKNSHLVQERPILPEKIDSKFLGNESSRHLYRKPFSGSLRMIISDDDSFHQYQDVIRNAVPILSQIIPISPLGIYSDRSPRNIIVQRDKDRKIYRIAMTDFEHLRISSILFELASATEMGLSSLTQKKRLDSSLNYLEGAHIFPEGDEISLTEHNLLLFSNTFMEAYSQFSNQNTPVEKVFLPSYKEALRGYLAIGTYIAMMHFSSSFYLYLHQSPKHRELNSYAMARSLQNIISYPKKLADMDESGKTKGILEQLGNLMESFQNSYFLPAFAKDLDKVKK